VTCQPEFLPFAFDFISLNIYFGVSNVI
jgi:hypothetical protein